MIFFQKKRKYSLFFRLFMSFMIVIMLLVSFNFFSISYFQNYIREEIILNNDNNLKNSSENFETYFQLLYNQMLDLYFKDHVHSWMTNESFNYDKGKLIRNDINTILSNKLIYLDNLLLYSKKSSLVLEKSGSAYAESEFSKFYFSKDYPYRFWNREFESSYNFRLFPASAFSEITFNDRILPLGNLFPFIIKNNLYRSFYFVAFIDKDKIIRAYHPSKKGSFQIVDDKGNILYNSGKADIPMPLQLDSSKNFASQGDYYYFYRKGTFTGNTYIEIIPVANISSQIRRLNITLLTLLIVTVLISLFTTILLSSRIINPVKQIIDSFQNKNLQKTTSTSIREFNLISQKVSHMIQANQDIHDDLLNQKSVLKNYAYTNKLKKIHINFEDHSDLFAIHENFILVLFQLTLTKLFHKQIDWEANRAAYFINEYISSIISEKFEKSITFQIEKDQIISYVVAENEAHLLNETLMGMKKVFEVDKDFCLVTIAVSFIYSDASQITTAYDQTVNLIKQRKLINETQIIYEGERKKIHFTLTLEMQNEFETYLLAGNGTTLLQFVRRILIQMEKQNAVAAEFYNVAEQFGRIVWSVLNTLHLGDETVFHPKYVSVQLANFHDLQQLSIYLDQLLTAAADLIKSKKEERDHIISFVIPYIESNYFNEITLDVVASQLNITSGYLSTYFKEKTGENFIDYLNGFRIGKAKEALLQTNLKIHEIAAQVGYYNLNSFYRMFKKYAGLTPNEFRQTGENHR